MRQCLDRTENAVRTVRSETQADAVALQDIGGLPTDSVTEDFMLAVVFRMQVGRRRI